MLGEHRIERQVCDMDTKAINEEVDEEQDVEEEREEIQSLTDAISM